MKIIIFIDWFAPAYKGGGPIQSIVNLVNQPLEGVEYKIICSNKDLDNEPLEGISPDQWIQFNPQTEVWYASKTKSVLHVLRSEVVANADLFFINGIYSFSYNFLPLFLGRGCRKIISARGMLHPGALSQKIAKKKIYLALWKLFGIHRKNDFHATNIEEQGFIENAFGKNTRIYVAANLPRVLQGLDSCEKLEGSLILLSIGLVSPMKNYLEVLKSLAHCREKIEYVIYGPIKDPVYWDMCLNQMKTLPANITITYKGVLPSSMVEDALSKAHVFILPSKSENFGHAIVEALTAGKPVITSHNTPWNNLEAAHAGFNVTAEDHLEMSKAISFFASAKPDVMSEWSAGAKAYAQMALNIADIKSRYKDMFSA